MSGVLGIAPSNFYAHKAVERDPDLPLVADTLFSGLRISRELTVTMARRGRRKTIDSDDVLCREILAA